MRILTIVHGFHPLRGGAETAALEIAARTAAAGMTQTVLTAGLGRAPREEMVRGVRVIRTPMPPRRPGPAGPGAMLAFALGGLPSAWRLAGEADVVHAHFSTPAGLLALFIKRTRGRPYLVTLHGSDVPGYNVRPFSGLYGMMKPLVGVVWREAGNLVAVSEDLKRYVLEMVGGISIEVIPNGVDRGQFSPPVERGREPGRILLVGRLIRLKGHSVFLRALALLRGRWDGPLSAAIVGGGPELENLRREASALGLSDLVDIPGFLPPEELKDQYSRASLLVMPSLSEAFGLALVEGMASGLPIVASRVGGIPEAAQGGDALLVPPGDVEALAAAILQVLSDPARAAAMGRASRAASANFDWDAIAGRYQRLYERTAAEGGDG